MISDVRVMKIRDRNCEKKKQSRAFFTIQVALCHSDLSFNRFVIFFSFVTLGSLSKTTLRTMPDQT